MTPLTDVTPPLLDHAEIDADHQQFQQALLNLQTTKNTDFSAAFKNLHQLTEQHFAVEKQLMLSSAFPAESEHHAEHQRVLNEFKQFQTRIDKGLISFGRAFVQERLPQWFNLHVGTMDGALVAHLKSKHQS